MKNNRQLITGLLLFMTVVLLGTTFYISNLLSSPNKSPTQIQKTKAAQQTYTTKIDLADNFGTAETPTPVVTPLLTPAPTLVASLPSPKPTLLALAPTLVPTLVPTKVPTKIPTQVPTQVAAVEPTDIPEPSATPTLQPLLAYKSTTISPTLIPIKETGGMISPTIAATKAPTPTKKIQPTGVQNLPETGWVQTSSILFIVATTTILFSLLF
jgi:hypothetical protein